MKLMAKPIHNRTLRSVRKQFPFYLMMAPGLLFIAVMCYIPMGGAMIAFKDYNPRDGILGSPWMDPLFKNFEFFFKSETARIVTFNTLFYNIIEMVAVTLGALVLAILLSEVKNKFLSATYKGSILLPVFLSWIVVQYIVFGMLSVDRGIVNNIISSNGGDAVYWYSEPFYWRFIIPFAYLWKNIGYYSVLYVAAIAGINTDYYEAAQLDGASKWQQVKYVTLPLLKPIIIVLSLLWVGKLFNGGLGDWNGFYTLSNDSGALYAATDVIDTLVFRSLKKLNDYGMSSAIGLYQAVVGFVLVLVSNYIIKKTDPDSALF
jgi:putative aldouronate transport system permease protein